MRERRWIVVLAVALTVGLGLSILSRRGERGEAVRPEVASPEEDEARRDPAELVQEEASSPESAGAPEEPRQVLQVREEPELAEEPVASTFELRGRLFVADLDGSLHEDRSGVLTLIAWNGDLGLHHDLPVSEGAWVARGEEFERAERFEIEGVTVDGRPLALFEPVGEFEPKEDEPVEVFVQVVRRSVLRVVDEATGGELTGLTLLESGPNDDTEDAHPGLGYEERIVARGLTSPILLDAYAERFGFEDGLFLVGSENHAWARVRFDFEQGGERLVALKSAAGLTVGVAGVDDEVKAHLRLRRSEHAAPFFQCRLAEDGEVNLTHLPPGPAQVVVELGEWWKDPVVLAATSVELRAGEHARVDLTLAPAPKIVRLDVTGRVLVAEEWGKPSRTAYLSFLGTLFDGSKDNFRVKLKPEEEDPVGASALSFSHSRLPAGHYELELKKPKYSFFFELAPESDDHFEFVVGPPLELLVRAVDDLTGEDVRIEDFHWHPKRPPNSGGYLLETATFDEEERAYRIRTAAPEIELMVWNWGYQPLSEEVDLRGGALHHTVRLTRACGLIVRLADGDTPVPFPEGWEGQPTAVDGEGETELSQYGDHERRFMVSLPGTYELELPAISGYRSAPPVRIEIPAQEFVEHVVRLERK